MDFHGSSGFIGRVQPSLLKSLVRQASHIVPLAGLLLLAGCVTTQTGSVSGSDKVATLEVQQPSAEVSPANKEIACRIQMIDGVLVGRSEGLKPGHHRLIVALGPKEGAHTGDVDLVIPAAKDYRLKAEREDDTFTVSLVEVASGKTVATSSATAGELMTFQVFVIQK